MAMLDLPAYVAEDGEVICGDCVATIASTARTSIRSLKARMEADWDAGLCKCDRCGGVFEKVCELPDDGPPVDDDALDPPWWAQQ